MKHSLFFSSILIATISSSLASPLTFPSKHQVVEVPVKQTKVTVSYPFTNKSDKTVKIRRFDAPCACLTAETTGGTKVSKGVVSYAPGESGTIKGMLDLGKFKGTVEKKILVWTDSDKDSSPSIRLCMSVKVPHQIAAYPSSLSWKKGGSGEPQEFTIRVTDNSPIHITSHKSSSSDIQYTVETVIEGFEYKVTATPINTTKPLFASIRFTTDSKNPRSKRVTAFVSVKP